MNIGVLGAGTMTHALGRRFVADGHRLVVSYSRDPQKLEETARDLGGGTGVGSPADAAQFGDVLLLGPSWSGAAEPRRGAAPLRKKVIWSIVTPLTTDTSGLEIGTTTPGAEELARVEPGSRFIAGWPPFAAVLESSSTRFAGERQTLFY